MAHVEADGDGALRSRGWLPGQCALQGRTLSRPGLANWQCLDDIRALHAGLWIGGGGSSGGSSAGGSGGSSGGRIGGTPGMGSGGGSVGGLGIWALNIRVHS
jgi:hypothetical protein